MFAVTSLQPFIAVGVTLAVFVILQVRRGTPTDWLFLIALMIVTLSGILTPEEALRGFANQAMLTVAALLAVTAGLRATGVIDWIGRKLLGNVATEKQALGRLGPVLIASSAFLLNTAVVAMMMPVIIDWCRRRNVSPARLLLPLSYLAILGGVCTLIGTSTTLVANGVLRVEYEKWMAKSSAGLSEQEAARLAEYVESVRPMPLFELGYVGIPAALVGMTFMIFVAPRLLPRTRDILNQLGEQRREYLVEMMVRPDCPLIGQTIEAAGLRHLPGLFLIEIDRAGEIITPVTPADVIYANDRFVFTGVVSTIVDLEKIPGLVPAADLNYEVQPQQRQQRHLTEVVLSRTSPLIGATVREANFRQRYNAAVVAVHRNGVRLTNKIGSIRLEAGDTLLLQTRTDFVGNYRDSRDFYLVSSVEGAAPRRHDKMRLAAGLGVLLIAWLIITSLLKGTTVAVGFSSPAIAAITIAMLMVGTRCLTISDARNALDLQTLLTIAGALGLGLALQNSGAAESIARFLVNQVGPHPYVLLIAMYLLALVFTETITNNAVAAMLLPIAMAVAWEAGYNPRPFIMAITLAASLSFLTPVGYQANLMVMGPGGYKPIDYIKCGGPLAAIVAVTALILIPLIWPF
ncbi:MAG: SLC13 family permease [Planctomycetales bacterium]|nr:SLC13 family permease [Planctomycetales bacterium]